MFRKEKLKRTIFAIGEGISGITGAVFMTLDIIGTFANSDFSPRIIIYASFLIFFIVTIVHFISLNSILESKEPFIKFRNLRFEKDIFPLLTEDAFMGDVSIGLSVEPDILRVDIVNIPNNPTNNNKTTLSAEVEYFSMFGEKVGATSRGRWSETPLPNSIREISKVTSIEVDSYGNPHPLELAVVAPLKNPTGDVYIFNNETMFLHGGRRKMDNRKELEFKLGKEDYFAKIRIIGSYVEEIKWVKFCFEKGNCEILSKKPKFSKHRN